MQKRTRYGQTLILLTALMLAGCQLPSIVPKTNPSEVPQTNSPGTGRETPPQLRGKYKVNSVNENGEVVIPGWGYWEAELPKSNTLELFLRKDVAQPSSSYTRATVYLLIDNKQVIGNIINKGPGYQLSNGAKGNYQADYYWDFFGSRYHEWRFFAHYSPDFALHNSSGPFQVVTDPGEAYRYVWDVSSLVNPTSSKMKVAIYNDTGGGLRPWNDYIPLVVRLPKPAIDFQIDTPFFSPNQDGTLDTATGSIKAQGPWKLTVVDHGEITTGTGDAPLSWDGTIKGVRLPDGEYTLRLEDANNPSSKAEGKVVLDTVAPKIEDAYIHSIDSNLPEAGEAEFTYSVNASAVDQAAGGVSSEIDATSFEVTFPDAVFTSTGKSLKTAEGEYQVKYNLPSTSDKSPNALKYTAYIKDRAGNKSAGFNKNFSATIEREIQISYEPSIGVAAVGIRGLSANKAGAIKPLKEGDVFYSRSGNIAQIECYDTWIPSDPKFKGGTATYLVTKVSNLFPDEVPTKISFDDTFKPYVQNKHVFRWNGQVNNGGNYATTGRYIVELAYKNGWIKVKDPKFEFKVCDLNFIRPSQWRAMPPATFANITRKSDNHQLQQAAHILDGHILDGISNPDELFSSYFPNLKISRPSGYTEKSEQKSGYTLTAQLLQNGSNKAIYDEVRQIAKAVWIYGELMSSNDTVTRDAAILYGNGKVRWIRAVSYDYGGVFHTVYPNWRAQESFEKGI